MRLELVSASDIAERLGVARSVVSNWQKRLPDFPTPYATVAGGAIRIWLWPDVVSWHNMRERERAESLAHRKERCKK